MSIDPIQNNPINPDSGRCPHRFCAQLGTLGQGGKVENKVVRKRRSKANDLTLSGLKCASYFFGSLLYRHAENSPPIISCPGYFQRFFFNGQAKPICLPSAITSHHHSLITDFAPARPTIQVSGSQQHLVSIRVAPIVSKMIRSCFTMHKVGLKRDFSLSLGCIPTIREPPPILPRSCKVAAYYCSP